MAQTYTVKLVDETEWKRLVDSDQRYEHVDATNLGFADPEKRRAYVRRELAQKWPGAMAYLAQHEFEHLVQEDKTDQDAHGICHKKFKDVVRNVAAVSMAPFTGGLSLSAGTQGFREEADDIIPNEIKGGEGFMGGIPTLRPGQSLGTAFRGAAPAIGAAALGAGAIGMGGLGGLMTKFNPGAGGTGAAATAPSGATGNVVSKLAKGVAGAAGAGGGSAASTGTGFGFKAALGPAAAGLGIAGLGQMMGNARRPEIPELGQLPSIQQFRTDVQGKFGPLQERLKGLSSTALPDALASPIKRNYANQKKSMYSQYAAFRPGVDYATDSEYNRDLDDLNQRESESMAKAQLNWQGNERQNILGEAGIGDQELSYLQDLAQLDIDTIMARTGLAAEDANQIKQIFGTLGATVAGAGLMNAFRV